MTAMLPSLRAIVPTRSPESAARVGGELERELAEWPGASIILATGRTPASNRNAGAEGSSEEWLVFVDDDIHLPPGWGSTLATALQRADADLLGGAIRSTVAGNLFANAAEDFVIRNKRYPEGWYLVSAQLAVRASAFRALGGFDERLVTHEDWDLCRRAHSAGLTVDVDISWWCMHQNPTTWRGLMSRAAAYGAGDQHVVDTSSSIPATPTRQRADRSPVIRRAATWPMRQYAEIRGLGRSRTRSAISTALCVPWTVAYLRAQRAAGRAREREAAGR